ncbi:aldehyde ferredoxin oxidoreductase C-terminal domain-containing protein, partial [Nonomuraea sp. NPDC048892]|uniref:aldehyde ferredoxin oxidoreductase C-terminal domain-containing protein n=1 Tax=Nonomuraea sp. NPDC048892 TaxID=3154624 RepID=UPI0033D89D41
LAVAGLAAYYRESLATNPLAALQAGLPGFAGWADGPLDPGYASVRNFSETGTPGLRVPSASDYAGRAVSLSGACTGCPNDCLKVYAPPSAPERRTGGLGQEAFLSLGWNLGIDDLDAVLAANARCNDLGLDVVSLGGTIAFAMECAAHGLLPDGPAFGDAAAVAALIEDVATRSGTLGDLLAEGSARAAQRLGPRTSGRAGRYAITVKGAELPCFDPRPQPGIGLGYALAPGGPRYDALEHDLDFDPVAGLHYSFPEAAKVGAAPAPAGELDEERGRRSARLLRLWSGLDALNLCVFASSPTRPLTIDRLTALVTAVLGTEFTLADLLAAGQARLDGMRAYALREQPGGLDEELPARLHEEPVSQGPHKGAVLERTAFARARATFYDELGWTAPAGSSTGANTGAHTGASPADPTGGAPAEGATTEGDISG